MRLWLGSLIILSFGSLAWAAPHRQLGAQFVDGPVAFTTSGVPSTPTYAQIESRMADLARRFPNQAQVIQYGKTVQGRNLTLLKIENSNVDTTRPNRPAIEISGVIHGNEYLGIEDDMVAYFLEHQREMPGLSLFLASGGVIYYVPIVNPDGFSRSGRLNGHNKDLNRDFDVPPIHLAKLTEPETISLTRYLDREILGAKLKLKFTLDYHCCVPALITPWTYINDHPPTNDRLAFAEIAALQSRYLGFKVGNAMETVNYLAVGGSIDYFYAKYGALAFTIEGSFGGERTRLDKHLKFVDGVMQRYALRTLGLE